MIPTIWIGSGGAEQIGLEQAWEVTTGSHKVVVAVLDDSVEIDHPDLQENIWTNPGEILNGLDDDGNGYVDDLHGWDFRNGDNDPSADWWAKEGHGTAVAGVVGAIGDNGVGVTGVAWDVSIMPLKFSFDVASGLEAAQYAIDNGADILVTSFGGPAYSRSEDLALQRLHNAGILVVASAGNFHADNDRVPDYPSSADYSNILAVAANDQNSTLTSWSNRGQFSVDLMAPGQSIYTTQARSGGYSSQDYAAMDGSSFSAPFVAGVAALIKSEMPDADFYELKGRILAAVDEMESAQGHVASTGRLNGYKVFDLEPQPLLMIRSVSIANVIGDGDYLIDSGELLQLDIQLENSWMEASGVMARLSTESQLVDLLWDEVAYPDLDPRLGESWSGGDEPFMVYFRPELEGHQRIRFKLQIETATGEGIDRYFELEAGALRNGVRYEEILQQSEQDDFHSFHVDFPAGAVDLSVETTAGSGVDLDLMMAEGEFPQYVMNPESGTQIGPMTMIDGNATGNEQLSLSNSSSNVVEVVVVNFSQYADEPYTIRAAYHMADGFELVSEIVPTGLFRVEDGTEITFPDHGAVVVQGYQLVPGWNLISLPVGVDETSIQQFMQQFPEVASIWSYQQGVWRSALQILSWEMNSLTTFEPATGYWIKVEGEETLNGVVAGETVVAEPFSVGWNLFGVSNRMTQLDLFLQQHQADSIWSWEEGQWQSYHTEVPHFLNSLGQMEPGKGYYIHLSE